jgi:hypothetical protein
MRSRWQVLGLVLAVFMTARPVFAEAVPGKNQALLLLRILAYDHNLASRTDNKKVTIVVVYKSGSSDSDDTSNDVAGAIRDISKSTTIANNSIQVVRMAYSDKTFDADVAKAKAAALYIAPGLGDNLATITTTTQNRKLLSFTGTQDLVASGVAVGFSLDDGKPTILVNLPASRNEGADLDVALLRVAKIVKK